MTKLTRLPALTTVHLTFSQPEKEIGQEFNVCEKKEQGTLKTHLTLTLDAELE